MLTSYTTDNSFAGTYSLTLTGTLDNGLKDSTTFAVTILSECYNSVITGNNNGNVYGYTVGNTQLSINGFDWTDS